MAKDRAQSVCTIYQIPIELLNEFRSTPYDSMRDFLAIPALVQDALFPNPAVLEELIQKDYSDPVHEYNMYRWLNSKIDSPKSFNIFTESLKKPYLTTPYFIHIDLALVEDAAGMAMVHRDRTTGKYVLDFILAVESHKIVEKKIPIQKLKYIAMYLKYNLNYNVSLVTFDGWQSAESIQELQDNGIESEVQSVDRTNAPYDTLRDIIHAGQLEFYDYKTEVFTSKNGELRSRNLLKELLNLTKDNKRNKVDHVVGGSKDLSDALCGSVFGCCQQEASFRPSVGLTANETNDYIESSKDYDYSEHRPKNDPHDTIDEFMERIPGNYNNYDMDGDDF